MDVGVRIVCVAVGVGGLHVEHVLHVDGVGVHQVECVHLVRLRVDNVQQRTVAVHMAGGLGIVAVVHMVGELGIADKHDRTAIVDIRIAVDTMDNVRMAVDRLGIHTALVVGRLERVH